MESLHDKILSIGHGDVVMPDDAFGSLCYREGHRDARHAAAELAIKHDAITNVFFDTFAEIAIKNIDIPDEFFEALKLAHEYMKVMVIGYWHGQSAHDAVEKAIAKAKGK